MDLRSFIDVIRAERGVSEEEIVHEFVAAAIAAAQRTLDRPVRLEGSLGETGDIELLIVFDVVETRRDRWRELGVAEVRSLGEDYAAFEIGEELVLPLDTGTDRQRTADLEVTDALVAPVLGVSLRPAGLPRVLEAAYAEVIHRYMPATPFPAGSLGALLREGGGFLRGARGTAGAVTVTLREAFYRDQPQTPGRSRVEAGFILDVQRAGTPEPALELSVRELASESEQWAVIPTAPQSKPHVEALVGYLANVIASSKDVDRGAFARGLLVAAIRPAGPDSLMTYCQERLSLGDAPIVARSGGRVVEIRVGELDGPAPSLLPFGEGFVAMVGDEHRDDPPFLSLGCLTPESLTLRAPQHDDPFVRELVTAWRGFVAAQLEHHLARSSAFDPAFWQYTFPPFELLALLERRVKLGPPGPPPVPPFDEAALARAGTLVHRVSEQRWAAIREDYGESTTRPFAAYDVGGWTVVLSDALDEHPFRVPEVALSPPGELELSTVLKVDAWNPQHRCLVDGDPFAFRRFITWLRAGIERAGLDEQIAFKEDTLAVTEWLLFGQPDLGDRFLIDWRGQHDIAVPGDTIDAFAGIYGFSSQYRRRLQDRDLPRWRQFLREIIDPRFGYNR